VSGYIGSWVCNLFLQDGGFKVVGTVRDKNNETKIAPLRNAFKDKFAELELRNAELLDADSIDKAIAGADYVVHVASPFVMEGIRHSDELVKPAVDGTLNALKAAHKHRVKRVVVTSSVMSVMGKPSNTHTGPITFTEKDWSEPAELQSLADAYQLSKTLAEKAAWDYQSKLAPEEAFDLVCINPGLVMGPAFVGKGFTSGEILDLFMMGKLPSQPRNMITLVDVREVAFAHLQAIKVPEARN